MIAAGRTEAGAGATFAGWAGGFESPLLEDRHDPMSSDSVACFTREQFFWRCVH